MYVIKKYSASGIWSGQSIQEFDTEKEASDWLNARADELEAAGFDVSDSRSAFGMTYHVEACHDDMADSYNYYCQFEDNSPKYQCNLCGDDDFSSESQLDDHVNEYHVDAEDEAS